MRCAQSPSSPAFDHGPLSSKWAAASWTAPPPIVGVFVFLFFLFLIAGHYLGVLLVFNGGTACFIDPWAFLVNILDFSQGGPRKKK
jgi:hypothetical protein